MSIIQINKDINSSKLDFHLSSTISSIYEYDTDDAAILLDESNSRHQHHLRLLLTLQFFTIFNSKKKKKQSLGLFYFRFHT